MKQLLTPIISVNLQTELYAVEQTPVKKKKSNLQTATVSLRRQSPSTNNEPIITGKRSAILRQPVLEFVAGNTQLSDKWFHAIRECLVAYHGTAKSITFTNDAILRTQSVSSVPPAIPSLVAIIVIITRIIRRIKRKRLAATKIQNAFRNFLDRRNYLHLIRQRALVLEADIRRLRSRRMLKQLIRLAMHMRAKRQLILGELMETEQHYIDNMEITMRVFVKPMQLFANRLDLNEDKISRVYGNIEQVLTSHRQMLDRLREIAAQCGPGNTADIAVILALCSEICAWMPSVYSQYISNYGKSVSTLRQCRRNYEFRSFLEVPMYTRHILTMTQ
jgi:hypothetical protein